MNGEIPKQEQWEERVFALTNDESFPAIALELFRAQFYENPVYRQFCRLLGRSPETVTGLDGIPFLPISFFKTHRVTTTAFEPEAVFESSGTTGQQSSRHFVRSLSLYEKSFLSGFERRFGPAAGYCILALLPSYLERGNSSLVYMADVLIRRSGHPQSGFYLYDLERLSAVLGGLRERGQKTVLLGVTYALLDFAERFPQPLPQTLIMETGGMKGRKEELTREELYDRLKAAFRTERIFSEYGMTELLSQAYAENGRFQAPPWMKAFLREETDPLQLLSQPGRTGALNLVDLANVYSCAFIATDDLGRLHADGSFEVLGRMDNSDIRGCSLLAI